MGWAFGTNHRGRDIGYGIEATCDEGGCKADIDRGLDYLCGGLDAVSGEVEHGCGNYFCAEHLYYVRDHGQLCGACADGIDNPEQPQWHSQGSSNTIRFGLSGDEAWDNAEHRISVWDDQGNGKDFPLAEYLARHLNATGFTPESRA